MKKGFIQIPLLIGIIAVVALSTVFAGGVVINHQKQSRISTQEQLILSSPSPESSPVIFSSPSPSIAIKQSSSELYTPNPVFIPTPTLISSPTPTPNSVPTPSSTLKPIPTATPGLICTSNWRCGGWSECVNNLQGRTCTDLNNCGTLINKPVELQSCVLALSISNIRIVDATSHFARFSWETNQNTYGIVILTNCVDENNLNCVDFVWGEGETQFIIYGYSSATNSQKLTDGGYFSERTNKIYVKQHQLNFTALNLGNNYYYRIIVINENGEIATSPNNIGNYYAKF